MYLAETVLELSSRDSPLFWLDQIARVDWQSTVTEIICSGLISTWSSRQLFNLYRSG